MRTNGSPSTSLMDEEGSSEEEEEMTVEEEGTDNTTRQEANTFPPQSSRDPRMQLGFLLNTGFGKDEDTLPDVSQLETPPPTFLPTTEQLVQPGYQYQWSLMYQQHPPLPQPHALPHQHSRRGGSHLLPGFTHHNNTTPADAPYGMVIKRTQSLGDPSPAEMHLPRKRARTFPPTESFESAYSGNDKPVTPLLFGNTMNNSSTYPSLIPALTRGPPPFSPSSTYPSPPQTFSEDDEEDDEEEEEEEYEQEEKEYYRQEETGPGGAEERTGRGRRGGITTALPPRNRRRRVTPEQKRVLEESFAGNTHPSRGEKERLALLLDMTTMQVQSW